MRIVATDPSAQGSPFSGLSAVLLPPPGEHREIEGFINLPDVVFRGQHAVLMLVAGHPAVALGVACGAVELT